MQEPEKKREVVEEVRKLLRLPLNQSLNQNSPNSQKLKSNRLQFMEKNTILTVQPIPYIIKKRVRLSVNMMKKLILLMKSPNNTEHK